MRERPKQEKSFVNILCVFIVFKCFGVGLPETWGRIHILQKRLL